MITLEEIMVCIVSLEKLIKSEQDWSKCSKSLLPLTGSNK